MPRSGDTADKPTSDDPHQLNEAIRVVNRRHETEAILTHELEQRDYARDVRNQSVYTASLSVLLVGIVNVLIISWEKRVVLSLVVTGCCYHALTQRLHGLSQDYAAHLASNLREPLVHPPPSSSTPNSDKADAQVEFESAEWLNGLMLKLWPIIDRQLFVAAVDLMEDEMMALMPSIIHSVKITSLEQGTHPVQLLGMRVLPPQTTNPATSSNFHVPSSSSSSPTPEPVHLSAPPFTRARHARTHDAAGSTTSAFADPALPRPAPFAADADEQADDPDQVQALGGGSGGGQDLGEEGRPAIELEVEFGYRRRVERKEEDGGEAERGEGKVEASDPTDNIHFVAYLGIGVGKLTTVPFPVLMSVASLRGAARIRLSFTPELPFVKTAVVSLREMPVVAVTAHPLQGSWDVVPLPIVRTFVDMAIRATLANLVLPRRYAIDVRKLLLGGDVAVKTRTIGLVVLVLHRAHLSAFPSFAGSTTSAQTRSATAALSVSRARRTVDPYVEASWAGMAKALYRTKVVRGVTLGNPVGARARGEVAEKKEDGGEARWEEMCFIRVPLEPVEDGAKIRLRVLDHERIGASHSLGYLDLPVRDLHDHAGKWRSHEREKLLPDAARGETERGKEDEEIGELECSVAFFPLLEKLEGESDAEKKKPDLMADVDFEHRKALDADEHEKQKRTRLDAVKDLLAGNPSAPPSHPSGILSYQIHSVADLELDKRVGAVHAGLKRLKPGTTFKAMRRAELPSTYVQAVLNDEMVFRTKLSPFSNAPTFNSGSETFVRDWTQGMLNLAVMDYRDRDHDVLVGYVSINLHDVLSKQAQLSKWFPLLGGSGAGRIRLSLLFKPLALDLAPSLREWSVGTVQIVEASLEGLGERNFAGRLSLKPDEGQVASVNAVQRQGEDDDAISFDLSSKPASIPVLSRIAPIKVSVQGVAAGLKHSRPALARGLIHVSDVRSGETVDITVRLSRDKKAVLPEPGPLPSLKGKVRDDDDLSSSRSPADSPRPPPSHRDDDNPPIILTLRARFVPGLSSLHGDVVLSASSSARAAYQLYLHRRDYEAQLRASAEHAGASSDEHAPDGEEWETATDAGGEGGAAGEIVPQRDGTRSRKGGSFRWVRHNAKVLARKVKKARAHQLNEPKPETEIQASL
ncbi:uncharacterized protein RHOBADRAFT_55353 [Rhodotorula graminis WP1]|uniref:Uncharacterized protein n=1 Tax=Rhodotorula graminis (strain WP1) TaxID=578459 RepID=A0A0P9EMS0_RHOGW|nr:uncharacterized protein RHOBADRAFT_55353 [Rhodotorula graminis WP1]KPV73131.1 hypothetical protein RHOBADRAFT_55353 [Rhodotorula graminis WP1]